MPDLEDLGCFVIGGIILVVLLLLAACVVVLLLVAGIVGGEGAMPGPSVEHLGLGGRFITGMAG